MNSVLRSKRQCVLVALTSASLLLLVYLALFAFGNGWTEYDFRVLDLFYRRAVGHGLGPKQSPQIVFVTITDATYNSLGRTSLDRTHMAGLNDAFSALDIEALAYDLIFARPGNPDSDARFEQIHSEVGLGLPAHRPRVFRRRRFLSMGGWAFFRTVSVRLPPKAPGNGGPGSLFMPPAPSCNGTLSPMRCAVRDTSAPSAIPTVCTGT